MLFFCFNIFFVKKLLEALTSVIPMLFFASIYYVVKKLLKHCRRFSTIVLLHYDMVTNARHTDNTYMRKHVTYN